MLAGVLLAHSLETTKQVWLGPIDEIPQLLEIVLDHGAREPVAPSTHELLGAHRRLGSWVLQSMRLIKQHGVPRHLVDVDKVAPKHLVARDQEIDLAREQVALGCESFGSCAME